MSAAGCRWARERARAWLTAEISRQSAPTTNGCTQSFARAPHKSGAAGCSACTRWRETMVERLWWRSTLGENTLVGRLWWRKTLMEKHSGGEALWWRSTLVDGETLHWQNYLGGETMLEKKRCHGLNVPHISDQNYFCLDGRLIKWEAMWPEWSKSSFFALFTHREVQQPRQKPIQGLAAGDGCPGICANHINCDFKSEFHPFHLSSVIQGPIQWVALLKSAHLWFHLYEGADFCSTGLDHTNSRE